MAAALKAQAMEEEAQWVTEEKLAAARQKAMLEDEAKHKAKAEQQVKELEPVQGGSSLSKQKGWVESEWVICDCCVMRGCKCQVSCFLV